MGSKKKLGRGLKFLLSEKETPAGENQTEMDLDEKKRQSNKESKPLSIPIDSIKSNPYQPRSTWDQEELKQLSDSVKENGILQPILVRKIGNTYQIIAGERRVRAARIAGKKMVPAIVRSVNEEEMQVLALIENLQREDLNPIEKAKSFESLRKKTNWSHEALSLRLGLKRSTVSNYLRLLELPPEAILCLEKKQITMGHARAILSAPPELQEKVLKETVSSKLSVRATEKLAKTISQKVSHPPIKQKVAQKKPAWLLEWEEILKQILGCQISIKYKGGKGKIELSVSSKPEMTRVLNFLMELGEKHPTEASLLQKKRSVEKY